jgi:hypothetical protein
MPRTAFRQEGEDAEDTTPIHMIMIGASHGKGVQQGFPSKGGVPRLIQFETLRWRPKITQVRVHLRVQEQHTPKMRPRMHTKSVLDVIYMDGKEFHRASNGTSPTSKFHLSQQKLSKQVDIQNLSGCCAVIFWAIGPCIVFKPK